MPTLEETIKGLKEFVIALDREMPKLMLETAITGKSLIQNRIQETGINADNRELGIYSNLSKTIRKESGKQIAYIDLTFSGRMWVNIGIIKESEGKNKYTATIGAKTEDNQKKLSDNTVRFGEILKISEGEKEKLELIAEESLNILAKKYIK
jgi:hypothetical protein